MPSVKFLIHTYYACINRYPLKCNHAVMTTATIGEIGEALYDMYEDSKFGQ